MFANYKYGSYKNALARNVSETVGDDIALRPWAELLVGVTHVDLQDADFDPTGATTSNYDKAAYTPNASLVLKPLHWLPTSPTRRGWRTGPTWGRATQTPARSWRPTAPNNTRWA